MAFDKDAYKENYLRPKSRQKLTALPDDLFERYAITLPAKSDADIAATIKAVRSFWSSQQPGTPAHKFAKMCIAADEILKQQKIGSGSHKGKDMLTAAWWEAKRAEQDNAAKERISNLASLLKASNGAFRVVTRSYLATCADRLSLYPAQAAQAASEAKLEVVDDVDISADPPISEGQYRALEGYLSVGQVSSVPDLIHPGCPPFKIVARFESVTTPTANLDVAAVRTQEMEAQKKAVSANWDARRSALNILRSEAESGADLRKISLYHLASSALGSGVPGAAGLKAALKSRGVDDRDASILAVVLADHAGAASETGSARVGKLLEEGRLQEAEAVARGLPMDGSDAIRLLLARIEVAKAKLAALLEEARNLLAVPDEIGAAAKVREAAAISSDDAEAMMALVPLASPRDPRIDVDGTAVRLHWQPNVGHDGETAYTVVRSVHAYPSTPANGTPLPAPSGTSATDNSAPVARPVYYSVFAAVPGRPTSRPVSTQTVLVPAVSDARMETGPDWVSAHWSMHPGAHHVEAVRPDGGGATPVEVKLGTARLSGLPEGVSVHIELTAVYEKPEGGWLRSAPVMVAGTPRAAAKPLENLRAQPIAGPSGVRVRFTWTPIDRSDVRLRRNSAAPRWSVGEMVTPEEMAAWGTDVTGPMDTVPGQTKLESAMPSGVHHVIPFSLGGTGIVVGRPVSVGLTDPVSGLHATPFSGFARLAWTWPDTSNLVEVSWERDDADADAVGLEKFSRAEYDSRGVTVPLGSAPCEVAVRALMLVGGETFASPPATLTINTVSQHKICYKVGSSPGFGPLGGRSKKLTMTAEESTGPVRIALVAAPGAVMPMQPDDGLAIFEKTVSFAAGVPQTFPASVPKAISKPYWVRCFVLSGNAQLEDPPLSTLKEG